MMQTEPHDPHLPVRGSLVGALCAPPLFLIALAFFAFAVVLCALGMPGPSRGSDDV